MCEYNYNIVIHHKIQYGHCHHSTIHVALIKTSYISIPKLYISLKVLPNLNHNVPYENTYNNMISFLSIPKLYISLNVLPNLNLNIPYENTYNANQKMTLSYASNVVDRMGSIFVKKRVFYVLGLPFFTFSHILRI